LAARLVAEKTGMPWITAMHIPIALVSAHDPPLFSGAEALSRRLRFLGPAFWGLLRESLRWATRPWARPVYRLREELGLPPTGELNPITDGVSPRLHLALFSGQLADRQPDWPAQTVLTGFPWYEPDSTSPLPPALARFLDDGPPPLVFTLGTAVASDPGPFYEHSAAAAKLLRRRAVLIAPGGSYRFPKLPAGMVACDYAPFAQLFPRAAAIVHHGGIGTTGLAMRSGRPMLVMPCAWDQPDNAERAARLGIARTISRCHYTPARVAAELRRLLDNGHYSRRAALVGALVEQEDGVGRTCDELERFLQTAHQAGSNC
jgi:UDP:flavonoid glycosyltransferase YjiC (YdhE family)